jgi:hypothetical protein
MMPWLVVSHKPVVDRGRRVGGRVRRAERALTDTLRSENVASLYLFVTRARHRRPKVDGIPQTLVRPEAWQLRPDLQPEGCG